MTQQFGKEWDAFLSMVASARSRMQDRYVPVCMILLQAERADEESVDVFFDRDGICLWPKDVPIPERGPLLKQLARPYEDGTVLRTTGKGEILP